jgi:cardiolipin synthase
MGFIWGDGREIQAGTKWEKPIMLPIPAFWHPGSGAFLVTAIYLSCAGAVTIDVLLKKGDVRSALGWIAVAWLSPILGALVYYLFGINRVTRRALRFGRMTSPQASVGVFVAHPITTPRFATLADIGRRITGRPLTAGNQVVVLEGGDVAYPAMLHAIQTARKSVALASYIFRDDAAGKNFVTALGEAHQRGVAVRVLLDGVGSGYIWSGALHRLKSLGVPAAHFLHIWIPWRMPFLNMRNHRKLLIVDGRTGFVGGMNIGAEYARSMASNGVTEDIHFRIDGPVVRQIMDAFARDWAFATDEVLNDEIWWPMQTPSGQVFARGIRSGPDGDIYRLESVLGAALSQAQHRIRIVTPYFLPDQRLQFAIAQAVLRGVQVDILIPERCDYRFLDWAIRAHLRFFEYIPANIYFTRAPFDHAKLVTIDGEWCLIGSSNWDTRSFRLNFEFDIECYDAELAASLDRRIDEKMSDAGKLDAGSLVAPLWELLRDAGIRLFLPYL